MRKYPVTKYPLNSELDLFSNLKDYTLEYSDLLKRDISESLRNNDKIQLSNEIDKHDRTWSNKVLLLSALLIGTGNKIKKYQYDNYFNQNLKAFSDNQQKQMIRIAQLSTSKNTIDFKLNTEITLFNENLQKKLELSGLYTNQAIKDKVLQAINKNLSKDEIINLIDDEIRKQVNNIAFNTRDKVSSLNSQILKDIHLDTGIIYFYWVSMRDDRVRDKHRELDNDEQYSYLDPPHGILPGEEPNCRCIAQPVIDDEVIENFNKLSP